MANNGAAVTLVKNGSGAVTFSAANTYTGATTIYAGTLTFAGANTCTGVTNLNGGTLVVSNSSALQFSTLTFNGGALNTGALSSVPVGGIAANVNTTVSSALTTIVGDPTWAAAAGTTLTLSGSITRSPGASINFSATGTVTGGSFGALLATNTVTPWATTGGADWAIFDGTNITTYAGYETTQANWLSLSTTSNAFINASSPTANLDDTTMNSLKIKEAASGFGLTVTINSGKTLTLTSGGLLVTTNNGGGDVTITGGTIKTGSGTAFVVNGYNTNFNLNIASVIADNSAAMGLTKTGPGTLILKGLNTYSGDTIINSGVVQTNTGAEIPNGVGKGNVNIGLFGTLNLNQFAETINGLNGAGTVNSVAGGPATLTVGSGNADGTFSGLLKNSGGALNLVKTGSGTQILSGTNTNTGTTTISGGVLQATDGTNLPTASFLSLDGGVLQSSGSFTRLLATSGAGKFQWTANGGGFSANGGKLTVNVGGAGSQQTFGSTVGTNILGTLQFGSLTANAETEFQNPINLNAANRTVNVTAGAGGDWATLSGTLSTSSGTAGLIKAGSGVLRLSNTANSYNGATTVQAGTLEFTSLLALGNPATGVGTIQLATSTSPATLRFIGSNGGTTRAINLQGTGTIDVSNTSLSDTLDLHASPNSVTVTGAGQNLTLTGTNGVTGGEIGSPMSLGSGSLTKNGVGVWTLDTSNSFTGSTTLNAGTLILGNNSGSALGSGDLTFNSGTCFAAILLLAGAISAQAADVPPLVRPTPEQVAWQDLELGMFFHFDIITFTDLWEGSWQGAGHLDPNLYNPTKLNTDQWMEAAQAMGAKYSVFVAKHCTGFISWQSDAYPYGVRQSKWRDGKGNVVADYVGSCRKYGVKPGLYCSMPANAYCGVMEKCTVQGAKGPNDPRQVEYRRRAKMVTELWGNYGPLAYIWFDGGVLPVEKGGADLGPIQRRLQPHAVTFGGPPENPAGLSRWPANENGVTAYPNWSTVTRANDDGAGNAQGKVWEPAECDAPLRDTWFWNPRNEKSIRSLDNLMDMYYKSVGRNANLILNASVDRDGLVPAADMRRFKEFGDEIRRRFSKPIAETSGEGQILEIDLGRPTTINHAIIMEKLSEGERIRDYTLEGYFGGAWKELSQGQSVGHKRIAQFNDTEVSKIRLRVTKSIAVPQIRQFAVFHVTPRPK